MVLNLTARPINSDYYLLSSDIESVLSNPSSLRERDLHIISIADETKRVENKYPVMLLSNCRSRQKVV